MTIVEIILFALLILLLLIVVYLLWRQMMFRRDVIRVVLQSDRLNSYFYSLFSDAKKIAAEYKGELKTEILAELRNAGPQKESPQKESPKQPVSHISNLLDPL
jgi:hypothetical protein